MAPRLLGPGTDRATPTTRPTRSPPPPASSAPTAPPAPAASFRRSPATTARRSPTRPPPPTSPTCAAPPAPTAAAPCATSPAVSPEPERRTAVGTPEPSTATRTIRELIEALTQLANADALPRGLDTPIEVGLVLDDATFDACPAFSVEPVTATWPGFRPDGAECRFTTVSLIGDPSHPDGDRYRLHTDTGHPDWEDPQVTDLAGVIYLGGALGPTGDCGIRDGGDQTGPCPFCGGPRHSELEGRCPHYRLRLAPKGG